MSLIPSSLMCEDCEFYRVGSDVESNCSGDSVVSVVCLAL